MEDALKTAGLQRHRFLRELFSLSQQVPHRVFLQTVERARRYRVFHLVTLQRIAWFCMSQTEETRPPVDVDESFRQRPTYQEGCLTDEPDLSVYDEQSPEENDNDDNDDQPESEDNNG